MALNLEERLAFGTVLGAMAVAVATFIPAMVARDVTVLTVILGLAVAFGIVRRHHGGIRVTSVPGRGTTVEVAFPVAARPAATPSVNSPAIAAISVCA